MTTTRPILFSAPMVRALLDGSKTQTRRIVKPQPTHFNPVGVPRRAVPTGGPSDVIRCPYGQPGDRLWVREAYRTVAEADALPPRELTPAHRIWYEADTPHQPGAGKLRPGMFMPRWASRITLEITGVRVERLQDISEIDALAEGVRRYSMLEQIQAGQDRWARHAYRSLWEQINGPGSWDANPFVWVVEFKRATP